MQGNEFAVFVNGFCKDHVPTNSSFKTKASWHFHFYC